MTEVSTPTLPVPSDQAPMEMEESVESSPVNGGKNVASPHEQIPVSPVASEATLTQLARQLEYYFSTANLGKDTYLRTLRDLNDGFVPASILAGFGKVQSLCPFDCFDAVIKAASEYSEHLEVVFVDKESSKRVDTEGDANTTLLAVGPKDSKPIDLPSTPNSQRPVVNALMSPVSPNAALMSPAVAGVQNTVILREVHADVTEDDLRELFDFEGCPPIQNIYQDPGTNYWFVVLNPTIHDEMVNVMFTLRDRTLKEESFKARLKSGTLMASPSTPIPPVYVDVGPPVYAGDRNTVYNKNEFHGGKNNKNGTKPMDPRNSPGKDGKKSNRGKNNRGNNKNKQQQNHAHQESSIKPVVVVEQPPPPPLVESQFPSLEPPIAPKLTPKEEEEEPEDDTKLPASDGASTATTSTSSSLVGGGDLKPKMPVGGYAAALLKAPPVKPTSPQQKSRVAVHENTVGKPENGKSNGKNSEIAKQQKDAIPREVGETIEGPPPREVEAAPKLPMSWGGGRSFADVLKKKETAAAALTTAGPRS